ncbi:MAG TPA: hypothetical protein GXX29_09165 [Firmicutes bacterium]|nr:hypothetical protein [Bacillota bacterium]
MAERPSWRNTVVRRYGIDFWDSLHWYVCAALVWLSYLAQPKKRPLWLRLLFSIALTLIIGLVREWRQHAQGWARWSVHDMQSNLGGTFLGTIISLITEAVRNYCRGDLYGRRRR